MSFEQTMIEVESVDDAYRYCEENGLKLDGISYDDGRIYLLVSHEISSISDKEIEYYRKKLEKKENSIKDHLIYTEIYNGTIYVKQRDSKGCNVTYIQSEAKLFTREEAFAKAGSMTKNSKNGYTWKAMKCHR